ncbi:MAG: hypothetical protein HY727_05695 [Candidatus Rokubacteria bacterium]|nr:hypothetical protein [Candidatus Rokubacteria bacterium]
MSADLDNSSRDALGHAWDWFAMHAGQRMQSFNFFLVATAFLVAGYATVLKDHRGVAAAIALLGAWLSVWFNRLEKRTKQLVKAGEAALEPSQQRLANLAGNPHLSILAVVNAKAPGSSSYAVVINVVQWTTFCGFSAGAAYASWPLLAKTTTANLLMLAGGACLLIGLWMAFLAARYESRILGEARLGFAVLGPDENNAEWREKKAQRRWADRFFYAGLVLTSFGVILQTAGAIWSK